MRDRVLQRNLASLWVTSSRERIARSRKSWKPVLCKREENREMFAEGGSVAEPRPAPLQTPITYSAYSRDREQPRKAGEKGKQILK